ncbi:MAG: hypothetical protein ACYS8W_05510 [Planctomycetota bacterium]|jgi:hypothetical protein
MLGGSRVEDNDRQKELGDVVRATIQQIKWKLQQNLLLSVEESTQEPSNNSEYIFRLAGNKWIVRYEGSKEYYLDDMIGMKYIRYLISHPGETFYVLDLEAFIRTGSSVTIVQQDAGPALDPRAKRELRQKREELIEKIEAGQYSDPAEHAQDKEDVQEIEKQLSADIGLGGRDRRLSDEVDKCRKRVCGNIENALKKIQNIPELTQLYTHLNNAITRGRDIGYTPEKEISWNR